MKLRALLMSFFCGLALADVSQTSSPQRVASWRVTGSPEILSFDPAKGTALQYHRWEPALPQKFHLFKNGSLIAMDLPQFENAHSNSCHISPDGKWLLFLGCDSDFRAENCSWQARNIEDPAIGHTVSIAKTELSSSACFIGNSQVLIVDGPRTNEPKGRVFDFGAVGTGPAKALNEPLAIRLGIPVTSEDGRFFGLKFNTLAHSGFRLYDSQSGQTDSPSLAPAFTLLDPADEQHIANDGSLVVYNGPGEEVTILRSTRKNPFKPDFEESKASALLKPEETWDTKSIRLKHGISGTFFWADEPVKVSAEVEVIGEKKSVEVPYHYFTVLDIGSGKQVYGLRSFNRTIAAKVHEGYLHFFQQIDKELHWFKVEVGSARNEPVNRQDRR